MAPGNMDREAESRNANANYNRDKVKKPFLRMPTQMQNKIDDSGGGADDDFSLDLLDEAQMARLKRAFCIFDKDDSGKISHQEMMGVRPRGRPFSPLPRMPAHLPPAPRSQVLRLLGTNPTNGELEDIIRGIDLNQDGFIDFLEFARVWCAPTPPLTPLPHRRRHRPHRHLRPLRAGDYESEMEVVSLLDSQRACLQRHSADGLPTSGKCRT